MPTVSLNSGFQALRGISRKRPVKERCELCGLDLGPRHHHLLHSGDGRICCACEACAVLFSHRIAGQNYLRIPRDARRLDAFQISDAQWNALLLPINMAFFLESASASRVVAYYPSPAGATESLLNLDAWQELVNQNPVLSTMERDVEALLVNHAGGRHDYYIAPLDVCYRLTGLIRKHWRGFSGGEEVWKAIDDFFAELSCA